MEIKGKMMLVANPAAGRRATEKGLAEVCGIFMKNGWLTTVFPTFGAGDAREYVTSFGKDYDRICAMGGDGTLNQVMSGMADSGLDREVAFIPAGSTNDYATTHGIPTDMEQAAETAAGDRYERVDIARFNDHYAAFHAAFGPLAAIVDNTPQDIKNQMGYLAYVLEGIKDAATFKPVHIRFTLPDEVLEGDYIYGAFVSTTTLGGGILKLPLEDGSFSDGEFELFLIRFPRDLIELGEVASELMAGNYNGEYTSLRKVSRCSVDPDQETTWSLDGERYVGDSHVEFEVLKQRIALHKPAPEQK